MEKLRKYLEAHLADEQIGSRMQNYNKTDIGTKIISRKITKRARSRCVGMFC